MKVDESIKIIFIQHNVDLYHLETYQVKFQSDHTYFQKLCHLKRVVLF